MQSFFFDAKETVRMPSAACAKLHMMQTWAEVGAGTARYSDACRDCTKPSAT